MNGRKITARAWGGVRSHHVRCAYGHLSELYRVNAGLAVALADAVAVESAADILVEEEEATPLPATDVEATKPKAGEFKAANAEAANRSRKVEDMRIIRCCRSLMRCDDEPDLVMT